MDAQISYAQAVRFSQAVDSLLTEFSVGITRRTAIETKINLFGDALRAAVIRDSDFSVTEFFEKKFKDAVEDLNQFLGLGFENHPDYFYHKAQDQKLKPDLGYNHFGKRFGEVG